MSALPDGPAPVARRRTSSVRPVAATLEQSLTWLDFVLGYPGGWLELRVVETSGRRYSTWVPSPVSAYTGRSRLAEMVQMLERRNADVECSMLRPKRGWGTCKDVPALHVRLDGGKRSANLLRSFRPVPTFVVREGESTRYTAFWLLRRPLRQWGQVDRANRRLAHALGAKKLHADPSEFYFAPPGSVLRAGRGRPCPVTVARAGLETYTVREVVGHLRDAPDPDAWRDAPGNTSGRRF